MLALAALLAFTKALGPDVEELAGIGLPKVPLWSSRALVELGREPEPTTNRNWFEVARHGQRSIAAPSEPHRSHLAPTLAAAVLPRDRLTKKALALPMPRLAGRRSLQVHLPYPLGWATSSRVTWKHDRALVAVRGGGDAVVVPVDVPLAQRPHESCSARALRTRQTVSEEPGESDANRPPRRALVVLGSLLSALVIAALPWPASPLLFALEWSVWPRVPAALPYAASSQLLRPIDGGSLRGFLASSFRGSAWTNPTELLRALKDAPRVGVATLAGPTAARNSLASLLRLSSVSPLPPASEVAAPGSLGPSLRPALEAFRARASAAGGAALGWARGVLSPLAQTLQPVALGARRSALGLTARLRAAGGGWRRLSAAAAAVAAGLPPELVRVTSAAASRVTRVLQSPSARASALLMAAVLTSRVAARGVALVFQRTNGRGGRSRGGNGGRDRCGSADRGDVPVLLESPSRIAASKLPWVGGPDLGVSGAVSVRVE